MKVYFWLQTISGEVVWDHSIFLTDVILSILSLKFSVAFLYALLYVQVCILLFLSSGDSLVFSSLMPFLEQQIRPFIKCFTFGKAWFKWWIQVIWFDFLYNFISIFFYDNSLLNNNYIFQEDLKCLMVPEVLPRCKKGKLKIKFKVNIRFMCLVSLFSIKVIVVVASFRY